MKIFLRASLIAAIVLTGLAISGLSDKGQGLFLITGLILLAIGIRVNEFLKGFTYTIIILASVCMALYYPQYFISIGDFQLKGLIIPLLQIIMFGMGSQMSLKDFQGVIMAPRAVLIGVICQFTIMPLVALGMVTVFDFPAEIAAGLILVGASPSGLASNVMSFLAKANVALSVTLTAVATVLAPLLTPLIMKVFAGALIPVDFWNMMLGIMNIVILPIIAGLIFNLFAFSVLSIKHKAVQIASFWGVILLKNLILLTTDTGDINAVFHGVLTDLIWFMILPALIGWGFFKLFGRDRILMEKILSFISMLGIAVIITVITAAGRDSLLEIGALLIIACFLHNMLGYGLGYWICKLLGVEEKSCRTIALEVGMQNSGLAAGIALQMGKVATVGLAPTVFGPLMNITGSSLATWWRGRRIRNED